MFMDQIYKVGQRQGAVRVATLNLWGRNGARARDHFGLMADLAVPAPAS